MHLHGLCGTLISLELVQQESKDHREKWKSSWASPFFRFCENQGRPTSFLMTSCPLCYLTTQSEVDLSAVEKTHTL